VSEPGEAAGCTGHAVSPDLRLRAPRHRRPGVRRPEGSERPAARHGLPAP